ncbi:MAG: cytochrome c [Magnetococcus sp. YQC-5]
MPNTGHTLHRLTVVAALLLYTLLGVPSACADITPERKQQLIHLLRHDCGSCHGMSLKGGLGPPLTHQALADKSSNLLEDTIYYGMAERAMPPWQELLSREEIHWLVERLKKGDLP